MECKIYASSSATAAYTTKTFVKKENAGFRKFRITNISCHVDIVVNAAIGSAILMNAFVTKGGYPIVDISCIVPVSSALQNPSTAKIGISSPVNIDGFLDGDLAFEVYINDANAFAKIYSGFINYELY